MTQISRYPISKAVYERIVEVFFGILVRIKTKKEARQFLEDFLTPTEQVMLTKRLAIAFLLEKSYDHRTIAKVLRVSSGTIARVNLVKKYGGDGYQKMIGKLMRDELIEDFLLGVAQAISALGGLGGKGSGSWRYLHREIEKKRKEKTF